MADTSAEGWHREDIKAALRKQFGSLANLSRAWRYHPRAVSQALLGRSGRSRRIEMRIAEALGVTPHTLWPDRWTPEGTRRPHSAIAGNPSRPAPTPHRQKRGRA